MSIVKIGEKEIKLKFTFNSFKYMEDFDLNDVSMLEEKPFKIVSVMETLLMGALNNSPKVEVSVEEVQDYLEAFIVDGDLTELLKELIDLLQESNFFKSLQKNAQ